jgi:hypothetical protein
VPRPRSVTIGLPLVADLTARVRNASPTNTQPPTQTKVSRITMQGLPHSRVCSRITRSLTVIIFGGGYTWILSPLCYKWILSPLIHRSSSSGSGIHSYARSLVHSELSWWGLKSSLHLPVAHTHYGSQYNNRSFINIAPRLHCVALVVSAGSLLRSEMRCTLLLWRRAALPVCQQAC